MKKGFVITNIEVIMEENLKMCKLKTFNEYGIVDEFSAPKTPPPPPPIK